MKKIKAWLARVKPWLKQHWHIVLVIAVALAVFLYVVLRKGTGVSALAFPPATTAGGAAGGDAAGSAADAAPATPVASPATPSGTAGGARGTSGGSLFDPPVQLKSIASAQAIPKPQTFSQTSTAGVGALLSGAGQFAAAVSAAQAAAPLGGLGSMLGAGTALAARAAAAQAGAAAYGLSYGPGSAGFSRNLPPTPPTPMVVARPPAPRTAPSGISQMWSAAKGIVPVGLRTLPTPPKFQPLTASDQVAKTRPVPR